MKKKGPKKPELTTEEVFRLLDEASARYEKYLEVTTYVADSLVQTYDPIKRDINAPLTLLCK